MDITRTFDLLESYRLLYGTKEDALAGKKNGTWQRFSTVEYIKYADAFSYGLMAMGLKKGDMVATISNNRPEWNFVDMGLSQAGIVHVPIYPTISKEDYDYILNHCEPKLVLVSDRLLLDKIRPIVESAMSIRDIYTFDDIDGAKSWLDIVHLGEENSEKFSHELHEIKKTIEPDDLVTLIYTSGTTGFPKGVMLSHTNLVTNFISTARVHNLDHNHTVLSFLPLSHVYERMVNYHFQYKGMSIYYAENMGTIVQDVNDIKPHVFNSVPRLLERIYDRIIGKGKDLPLLKKRIFFWAVNLGLKYNPHENSAWYTLNLKLADKLVFRKWREGLGNRLQIIVSGGAAFTAQTRTYFLGGRD